FMSTAIYTGPVALSFGGADLSWIIGLLVVSPVYYYLSRAKTVKKMAFAKEKI
ncbi:cytosine permease, partial [Escherichia coli]|nr:cytosine permease [Escherichia coli]